MFLTDYHMHSCFSPDANFSMREMAEAAAEKGINQVCFTDHIDDCYPIMCHSKEDSYFSKADALKQSYYETKEALKGKIDLRLGYELASPHRNPALAREIAYGDGVDFVIGSVHSIPDVDDFYVYQFKDEEDCRKLNELYLKDYIALAKTGCCDVLGHIGYTLKFSYKQGLNFDIMVYTDLLEELFHIIISKGIGIELNTSGMRQPIGQPIPTVPMLKLYRACGGEIITTGSDSHFAKHAGTGIQEAYEILKEIGFPYVATFKDHKVSFVEIR